MATKHGMQNVSHSKVKLAESETSHSITIQVDDASHKMYLSMTVLTIEHEGKDIVVVSSGTGLGGDFVTIDYTDEKGKEHRGVAYMREIAAQWIRQIDPKAPPELLDTLTPNRS